MARGVLTKGRKHWSRPGLVAQAPPQGLLGWEEGATFRQRAREGAAWGPLMGAEAWAGRMQPALGDPWAQPSFPPRLRGSDRRKRPEAGAQRGFDAVRD